MDIAQQCLGLSDEGIEDAVERELTPMTQAARDALAGPPPRQTCCRLTRIQSMWASLELTRSIRASIQGQSGCKVAAARERLDWRGFVTSGCCRSDA